MKIGIESQRIFRRARHGMDVVALELIRQLQMLDKKNEYLLFAKSGEENNSIYDTDNFKKVFLKGSTYPGWEQISLPAAVRKNKVDLLHCTANTAPYSCGVPMIVTVHDVIYLEETNFGGSAYQDFGNIYRKLVVPNAIRKAAKIVTVSEHEKKVITEVCNTDPSRIEVIHNGVSERFNNRISKDDIATFRREWQVPAEFILVLGNTAPKKNTTGILRAYVHYCSMTNDPLPLVITDYPRSLVNTLLLKLKAPGLIQNIITIGYVPSEQMPLLYNCSSLFVYPSLRESFGLPVLESMACGVPVITAGIPAIREVGGDAAMFIDPGEPKAIAEAIHELLNDEQRINNLVKKGLERAGQFSWRNSAVRLIKLYNSF
jgi:glycosyltransferase involved in cell wall biosynthesis